MKFNKIKKKKIKMSPEERERQRKEISAIIADSRKEKEKEARERERGKLPWGVPINAIRSFIGGLKFKTNYSSHKEANETTDNPVPQSNMSTKAERPKPPTYYERWYKLVTNNGI
ncbi:MAG: hypothetical protein J5616_08120 [Bacteroidaceae bacterium]|nr:hypothetical protein [Bacteroidaceae bacterium]